MVHVLKLLKQWFDCYLHAAKNTYWGMTRSVLPGRRARICTDMAQIWHRYGTESSTDFPYTTEPGLCAAVRRTA